MENIGRLKQIAFVLGLTLTVSVYFLLKIRSENVQLTKAFIEQQDSTHYFKDRFGKEHAYSRSITVDKATAAIVYKKKLDSISSLLKISSKDISNVITQTNTTTVNVKPKIIDTGFKLVAINPKDTSKVRKEISSFTGLFQDPWVKINARLGDSSYFKFNLKDTVTTVLYTKGFFKKQNYIDVKHSSPYTKTSDLKSLVIKDANGRLNFSLIAGYGYGLNLSKPTPIFGVGLSYRVFSIK